MSDGGTVLSPLINVHFDLSPEAYKECQPLINYLTIDTRQNRIKQLIWTYQESQIYLEFNIDFNFLNIGSDNPWTRFFSELIVVFILLGSNIFL